MPSLIVQYVLEGISTLLYTLSQCQVSLTGLENLQSYIRYNEVTYNKDSILYTTVKPE